MISNFNVNKNKKYLKGVEIYLDKVYNINISPIVVKEITDFIFYLHLSPITIIRRCKF